MLVLWVSCYEPWVVCGCFSDCGRFVDLNAVWFGFVCLFCCGFVLGACSFGGSFGLFWVLVGDLALVVWCILFEFCGLRQFTSRFGFACLLLGLVVWWLWSFLLTMCGLL